jgi:hypothetical protein
METPQAKGYIEEEEGGEKLLEFTKSNQGAKMSTRISKTLADMSIKCSCQRSFIAKQPYLDPSLCQSIYLNPKHKKNMVRFAMTINSLLDINMPLVHSHPIG